MTSHKRPVNDDVLIAVRESKNPDVPLVPYLLFEREPRRSSRSQAPRVQSLKVTAGFGE